MKRAHASTLLALVLVLSACVARETFFWYEPNAEWGGPGHALGCPIHDPARMVTQQAYPNLAISVSILDEINAGVYGRKDPTLAFVFYIRHLFYGESVSVKPSSPILDVELEDGTHRQFEVPALAERLLFIGENRAKQVFVPLTGVEPQNVTIQIPDFQVNDELLKGGSIRFIRTRTTQWAC